MYSLSDFDLGGIISYFLALETPWDGLKTALDIGVVSYIIYKLIMLVKETRAWQLVKGIAFVIIASRITDYLGLNTIAYILNNTFQALVLTLVILFQPELRRGLEQIGRSKFRAVLNFDEEKSKQDTNTVIESIVKACSHMSKNMTGALIVIERETKIGDIISTGVSMDSKVSVELLLNVFSQNTPLHDGAIIIRDNKIMAASCFLPLTENSNLSKDLGTRHRAALGITEVSDSIAVIVSEETGKINFGLNGVLTRNLTVDNLRSELIRTLVEDNPTSNLLSLWKVKRSD
ncbi:MAG: diadenylate cyclase CdaA [Clostridiales bacterium]